MDEILTLEVDLELNVIRLLGGAEDRTPNTDKSYVCLYIYAFRSICCLLFLAETTRFAFFGGKRRRIKDNKNAFLARFGVHFSGPFLTIFLMPYIYIYICINYFLFAHVHT